MGSVSCSFLILMIGTPPMIVEKVGHWAAGNLERKVGENEKKGMGGED